MQALHWSKHLIKKITGQIYKHLVSQQALRRHLKIKRCYGYYITDYTPTFSNLHNKAITVKANEVTFRLIFNMHQPWNWRYTGPIRKPPPRRLYAYFMQETEWHLIFTGPTVIGARNILPKLIRKHTNKATDIYKTIFLNALPGCPKETHKTIDSLNWI